MQQNGAKTDFLTFWQLPSEEYYHQNMRSFKSADDKNVLDSLYCFYIINTKKIKRIKYFTVKNIYFLPI